MTDCRKLKDRFLKLADKTASLAKILKTNLKRGDLLDLKKREAEMSEIQKDLYDALDPYKNWKTYKDREVVAELEEKIIGFLPHPFLPHPQGIVLQTREGVFLNGRLIFKEEFDEIKPSPRGVIIRQDDKFYLDGKLIYEGVWEKWLPHYKGIIIFKEGAWWINGFRPVCRTKDNVSPKDIHPAGILHRKDNKIFLNDNEKEIFSGDFDEYAWCPRGLIITKGDEFFLYKNGKLEYFCEGANFVWVTHPRGIMIRFHEKIRINDKIINFPKRYVDNEIHPRGVIVRKDGDNKFIFYEYKE